MGSNEHYSFMQRGGSYFVLAKIPHTLERAAHLAPRR
jgi:hypothetical protein